MRLTRLLQLLSLVVYVLAMVCPMALGQAQRAIILGRAADPSGGAIPGVKGKAMEVATKAARGRWRTKVASVKFPGCFQALIGLKQQPKGSRPRPSTMSLSRARSVPKLT